MTTYHWQLTPLTTESSALDAWAALYSECGKTPLLHPDLLRTALEVFAKTALQLGVCTSAGKVVAACVIAPVDAVRMSTFQPSQAPIGFWLQRVDVPISALLQSLSRACAPWVVSLGITQQDPALLSRPESSKGLLPTDYIETARITIDTDWDTYWNARGSNLRHNIKRAKAKLANAGKQFDLRVIAEPHAMADAVASYGELESRSWKASEGTAVAPDNDQGHFYARLLERFARRGRARCYQLLIDGKIAATDLCVCGDDEIVILKTTYDAEYKDYSPAFLMRELAFSGLFSESWCRRIEFYGRVMDWHLRWTDEVRRMYHITWFRYVSALALWQAAKRLIRSARSERSAERQLPQSSGHN